MRATKEQIITALDTVDSAYNALIALPIYTLLPSEQRALLNRLEEIDKRIGALQRRLLARLITEGAPEQFGAASWPEALSRRLRISQGEAQRRIAEAIYGAGSESTQ